MADNVNVTEGSGKVIATDDVGGAQYQRVKLDIGGDGASSPFTGTIAAVTNLAGGTVTLSNPTGTTVTVDHGTITLSNPTGTTVQFNNGTVDLLKSGTITRVEGGTITLSNPTGTTIQFNNGTVDLVKAGTITRLEGGTVQANILTGTITRVSTIGTLEVGTIVTLPNIPGGTVGLVTRVGNVGTLEVGTISSLPDLPGGTITSVTEVANLAKGTITRLEGGTLGVVSSVANLAAGTVSRVEQGSINITAGTINSLTPGTAATQLGKQEDGIHSSGDVGVMILGVRQDAQADFGADGDYVPLSIDADGAVRTSASISAAIGTISVGTINTGTIDLVKAGTITRVEGGSIVMTTGTVASLPDLPGGTVDEVTSVANLVGGTITRLAQGSINVTAGTVSAGTINTGTINVGTFRLNPIPTQVTLSYGTTTTGTVGTLVAAPSAGSAIFITACDVNVQSGTAEPLISFNLATNGQGVIARGNFAAGGGIAKSFPIPNSANNTGTALTFNILSGSGTVSYNVTYFVAVP